MPAAGLEIIHRATLDAQAGREGAADWLHGDSTRYWADLLGLDSWPPPIARCSPQKDEAPQALVAQGAD